MRVDWRSAGRRCGLLLALSGCAPAPDPADLVFQGGTIWTADPANPTAEAVAVRDGRIVFVGPAVGADPLIGSETEVVELGEGMLVPGFHDTHVHPVSGGVELADCDLNAAASREDVVRLVTECAARDPEAPWIRGGGFQLPIFPEGAPTRQLLDSLVPDRPAYLSSADGHSAWVNSRALELAGVTAGTPDPPPDGVIVRDGDGRPQGTLRESAMGLVARHVPPHTPGQVTEGLERALAMAASFGITTLHEASAGEAYLEAYRRVEEEGRLTARAAVALLVDTDRGTEQVAELAALRDRYMGTLVRPVAAKIFVDGVIEGQTAALLEPYSDRPDWRGELNLHPDSLAALVAALDDAGFKVHLHTIGDRAIRVALDAFEAQHLRDAGAGPRHIMSHIQLFHPDDIPRFAALGVVASFQPLWFYADTYITDLTEPRLGPDRSRWLYPARSVWDAGALVAGGSDWSVTSMNPLLAMETAVTRRDPNRDDGPSWRPEQRLTVEEVLTAYTLNGAVAGDMDHETGSVAVGKSADLVVLDTDLFAVPPEGISDARVEMTVFRGRVVYRR
ncbi:MAG TPA: amidohydrolase [Longimicrobiales bacterium]|nr:amidohydrolase [Longimicrobiales bacterium]